MLERMEMYRVPAAPEAVCRNPADGYSECPNYYGKLMDAGTSRFAALANGGRRDMSR
jgi:hypothetical protein